jgi:hypothetical protein
MTQRQAPNEQKAPRPQPEGLPEINDLLKGDSSSMKTLPVHVRDARWIDLGEGQALEGTVVRMPTRGAPAGTRLFIRPDGGDTVSIAATAKRGWSVLERALKSERVRVGDRILVEFRGWRQTLDQERRYRDVKVMVLDCPVERAA